MERSLKELAVGAFVKVANLQFAQEIKEGVNEQGDERYKELEGRWTEQATGLSPESLMQLCEALHFRLLKRLLAALSAGQFDQQLIKEIKRRCVALSMQREENMQRSRSSDEVKQLAARIPMIDVLQSRNKFVLRPFPFPQDICLGPRSGRYVPETGYGGPEYQGIGEFVYDETFPRLEIGEEGVVSEKEFEVAFLEIFAEGQFKHLDWTNVMAAGGAVMACLAPPPKQFRASPLDSEENKRLLRKWFHKRGFETSDIDLFIFGVSSEEEFRKKVVQIYQQVAMADCEDNTECRVVKTKNSFTIVRGYPYRCIQIMRAMYNTKADVLAHFDLDCVAVGYDGKSVVCLPRFRRAFRSKTNVFNGQLSLISCARAEKYNLRGFAFALPQFITIDTSTGGIRAHQLHMLLGLGKMNLLHSNHIKFNEQSNLRKWFSKEWLRGCFAPGSEGRSILGGAIEKSFQINSHLHPWPNTLEEEGSCGMYYFKYNREASLEDLQGVGKEFDVKKELDESGVGEVDKGPSWFGAPPTSDWELVGDISTVSTPITRQLVPLQFNVSVFEVVVDVKDGSDLMKKDASKKVDVVDSAGRAWIVHLDFVVEEVFRRSNEVLGIRLEYVGHTMIQDKSSTVKENETEKVQCEEQRKRNKPSNNTSLGERIIDPKRNDEENENEYLEDIDPVLCCANVLIGCTPSSWPPWRDINEEDQKKQRSNEMLWLDLYAVFTHRNMVSGKVGMWLKYFRPSPPSMRPSWRRTERKPETQTPPVMASEEVRLAFTIQTLNYNQL